MYSLKRVLHQPWIICAVFGVMFGGCNASQVSQMATALEQASASPTPSPSPSVSPSPGAISNSGAGAGSALVSASHCTYTVSFTYDLGPGIDVTQSFETFGRNRHGIPVKEEVLHADASHCPEGTMLPAEGDSQQLSVFRIISTNGNVDIYADRYSGPTVLVEDTGAGTLVTPDSLALTMTPAQVSNGKETQIFDSGALQSAQGSTNASMVLQVTYVFSEAKSHDSQP